MTLTIERKTPGATDCVRHGDDTVVIALLNNMPDGAIRSTEQQFARLLSAASGERDVRLRLYEMPEMPRGDRARSELLNSYRSVDELLGERVDGLIVTGCEPRAPTIPAEPFWGKLSDTIDWANEGALSSIWSCLAAHAAVLRLDGIERRAFDSKLSGVFECYKRLDHELVADLPLRWMAPHSRQYGLDTGDLLANGYMPLTESDTAGVDIFIKRRRGLYVLFQGHLEYEADSLLREYMRDITRFLNAERDAYPEIPTGLFGAATISAFNELRARAAKNRTPELMSTAPISRAKSELLNAWWIPAVSVYRRWLTWIAEAKAATTRGRPRANAHARVGAVSHAHG